MTSYRAVSTQVGAAGAMGGRGLFAKEPVAEDEIVCVKGGHMMDTAEFLALPAIVRQHAMQVESNLFLGPKTEAEIPANSMYLNHSCEPNVGIRGQVVFVALRDIAAAEQLVVDYAMMYTDAKAFVSFQCECGSALCRGRITASDWKSADLQQRYRGRFADFIERNLRACTG